MLELACALAGVTLVTANPAYQNRELSYVLEQSRSEALYYVESFRGNPMKQIVEAACAEVPAVRERILLTDHDALFRGESAGDSRAPKPSDVVQIQYTSGTTGHPKGALLHHNGLVRNGIDTTQAWYEDSFEDLTQTIGQPAAHVDVSIRDPMANTVMPIGAQGEICCRGYLVMKGYSDNPEATAAAIDAEGWLHTGDLGQMDARGYLKITGRVKEMIIRGGENLFPAEIENVMLEHEAIAEVAVVGIPDETWGEQIACFMRARGDAKPSGQALKAFIRERLSPQKTPVYWIWVDAWPLTGSRKIQKFKLREAFERGEFEGRMA